MKERRTASIAITIALVALVAVAALAFAGYGQPEAQDFAAQAARMDIIVPTYAATDQPGFKVNNKSAGSESLIIEDAGTPVAVFGNTGALDMKNKAITNVGAAGTDFSANGGLTLAAALVVSAGGIDVQASSITMANDETISNGTDTVIDISNFFAFAEQTPFAVVEGLPITPTGSYQPITSTAAVTTSTSSAIADGVKTGQLLVLVNENASDAIIIDDGANTKMGGNKTLTGGEGDAIYLIWDGADWLCIGYNDN